MKKIGLLIIAFTFIGTVLPPQEARALSCIQYSPEGDYNKSVAVFMGTADQVTVDGGDAFLTVTRSWKGPAVGSRVDVTSADPVTWGVKFQEGRTYLIFSSTTNPYTLDLCNSSHEVTSQSNSQGTIDILDRLVSTNDSHSAGTNVRFPDGTVYRISEAKTLQPYTSAGAFLSYKFNSWATVATANAKDMALPLSTYTPCAMTTPVTYFIPPRNGALINDQGTVYLITNGERAGFASAQAFLELGYSFSNVYPGDTSFICITAEPINTSARKHSDGTLINDNGTLYVMQNGYRVGFPNMAVLDSWGYWVSEAVPANSYDRQAEISGVMQTRMANQMSI